MSNKYKTTYPSPIGLLEIVSTESAIKEIEFIKLDTGKPPGEQAIVPTIARMCANQLDEYFNGNRQTFALNLEPDGTDFQKSVWQELLTIPYGQTVSYLDIAQALGNEKAIRAVGGANGKNPISIIIPCHRVIGSDGSLTGYGGGLWRKEWLLRHEGSLNSGQLSLLALW